MHNHRKLEELILFLLTLIALTFIWEGVVAAGSSGPFHAGLSTGGPLAFCSDFNTDDDTKFWCTLSDEALSYYGQEMDSTAFGFARKR